MKRYYSFLIFIIVAILASAPEIHSKSTDGVEFELIVRQKPAEIDKYFEVARDTVKVRVGNRLHTFMVNFRLDLDVQEADSQFARFSADLITIGSNPYNAARQFRVEYNLPARMENIPGKKGSIYQLLISPRGRIEMPAPACDCDPDSAGEFSSEPSANFELYLLRTPWLISTGTL